MTRLPKRWLAAGGAALLAGIVGTALLLQQTGSAACAAPPTGSTVHRGKATFFDMGATTGNCSLAIPADDLFVALGASEYAGAAACGSYLDVTGPKGRVRVKVIDSCPPCDTGHIDLSRTAFGRIADHITGIVPVTYRAVVNARVPGPLSIRFADGTSRYWFAALIDNHANPLTSVEVKSGGGGWRAVERQDDNYWVVADGAGSGPFTFKITDVYGRTGTAAAIGLEPNRTQQTSLHFGPAAESTHAAPSPSLSPSPTPSLSPSPTAAALVAPSAVPDTSRAPIALADTACA